MKFGYAIAALCLGTFALDASQASANEMSTGAAAATSTLASPSSTTLSVEHETGYVTTQGRRGGGVRRGGGRAFAVQGPRRRNNFGRNVGIGVGAAIIGGIIVNEVSRSRGGNSCSRWNYQCNNGAGWACRNLDRYC